MGKLDELKNYVADLFNAATDKTVIEKCAVVTKKIEEVEEEHKQLNNDYQSLLKDYKDVVVHSSYKPSAGAEAKSGVPGNFDANAAFNEFFLKNGDK